MKLKGKELPIGDAFKKYFGYRSGINTWSQK